MCDLETLAMRGLILYFLGRKAEALESIRNGIINGMQNHIVYHPYVLWQWSDNKYDEAIKVYKKALQLEQQVHWLYVESPFSYQSFNFYRLIRLFFVICDYHKFKCMIWMVIK